MTFTKDGQSLPAVGTNLTRILGISSSKRDNKFEISFTYPNRLPQLMGGSIRLRPARHLCNGGISLHE